MLCVYQHVIRISVLGFGSENKACEIFVHVVISTKSLFHCTWKYRVIVLPSSALHSVLNHVLWVMTILCRNSKSYEDLGFLLQKTLEVNKTITYVEAFEYLFERYFLLKIISWVIQNFFSIILCKEVGLFWAYLQYLSGGAAHSQQVVAFPSLCVVWQYLNKLTEKSSSQFCKKQLSCSGRELLETHTFLDFH